MQVSDKTRQRINRLELLVLDVDGVLTDGRIYLLPDGKEFKVFDVKDGMGIKKAQNKDLIIALISGRSSDSVKRRADELGINEVYQGISDKVSIIKNMISTYNISRDKVGYIGDDVNDLEAFKFVGVSIAVQNAANELKDIADIMLEKSGGQGAVRFFIDLMYDEGQNE
mgnify:CR=1 FL=1